MKHLLLLAACAVLMSTGVFAQGYYYITQTGTQAPYVPSNLGAVVLAQGSDEVLSTKKTIPFTWKFYGKDVTAYKASDNGYITFNTDDIESQSTNEALPSKMAPMNAIFAFWDDLKMEGVGTVKAEIRNYTYGTAPNRVHVIQWWTASKEGSTAGNTNYLYFAIRLYEGAGFDLVYNDASPNITNASGTIGCQNEDGTVGTMTSNSPNADFPNKVGQQNQARDKVYSFTYGVQLDVQAKVVSSATSSIFAAGEGDRIRLVVMNLGKKDKISSGKFNYTVDGGAVVSASFKSSIATNGATGNIISPANFVPTDADLGKIKVVKAWLSEINGMAADAAGANSDTATISIFVNKGLSASSKTVLLEEGSGGWCGFCPDGHRIMHDLLEQNPENLIGVVHHNSDGMVNTGSNTINTAFATGYPYGAVDRAPAGGSVGLSRTDWQSAIADRLGVVTPAEVKILNQKFDPDTRQITFDVETKFVDYALPGDIRINAFIVEDNVRGPRNKNTNGSEGTQWSQHNYYSKDDAKAGGTGHPLYEEPAYFFGYLHRHVVRSILVDPWGTKVTKTGDLPTNPALGSTYTSSFTYTLPEEVNVTFTEDPVINTPLQSTENGPCMNKAKDISIVAFAAYYKPDAAFPNANQREILNAAHVSLLGGGGTSDVTDEQGAIAGNVFPNPAKGLAHADFNLNAPSRVSAEIVNLVGQKVMSIKEGLFNAGKQSVFFNADALANGTYFISIKTEEGTIVRTFMVANQD